MRRFFVILLLLSACASPTRVPSEPDAPSIRVMTYNVNYGTAGDATTLEAIRNGAADIVFLQETTPTWEKQLEAQLADDFPHRQYHHCCGAGGLAVLSKYPIGDAEILEPPERGWFPAWKGTIDSPIGKIQAINVHLRPPFSDSGSVVSGYFSTPPVRRAEIEAYMDATDDKLPTIVAGDFNESRNGTAVGFLESRGMQTALPAFEPRAKTWRWNTSVGPMSAQLDHILHDDRLVPVNAEVHTAGRSDHLPVIATFVAARNEPTAL